MISNECLPLQSDCRWFNVEHLMRITDQEGKQRVMDVAVVVDSVAGNCKAALNMVVVAADSHGRIRSAVFQHVAVAGTDTAIADRGFECNSFAVVEGCSTNCIVVVGMDCRIVGYSDNVLNMVAAVAAGRRCSCIDHTVMEQRLDCTVADLAVESGVARQPVDVQIDKSRHACNCL